MKFGLTRIFDEISNRIQYGILFFCLAMSQVCHRNEDHEISCRLPLQSFPKNSPVLRIHLGLHATHSNFIKCETEKITPSVTLYTNLLAFSSDTCVGLSGLRLRRLDRAPTRTGRSTQKVFVNCATYRGGPMCPVLQILFAYNIITERESTSTLYRASV